MNIDDAKDSALETLLARLDNNPALAEEDAARFAAWLQLDEGLRPLTEGIRENHLDLSALQRLANEHRGNAGEKEIPEHLATCPICLDLFQSILDGVPVVDRSAMQRFENIPGYSQRQTDSWWHSSRRIFLSAAAGVIILLGAHVLARSLFFSNPPLSVSGGFTLANGTTVPAGGPIPFRRPFTMNAGNALALDDGGTSVRAETESEMSFSRSLLGNPMFVVNNGAVWVSAAKQKPGSSIMVRTPLGDIRVIGTEFRVTVESENVVVYENRPDQSEIKEHTTSISAVIVNVHEGTVSLRNRHDQVTVSAGGTAVMRQGQPMIKVHQPNSSLPTETK